MKLLFCFCKKDVKVSYNVQDMKNIFSISNYVDK